MVQFLRLHELRRLHQVVHPRIVQAALLHETHGHCRQCRLRHHYPLDAGHLDRGSPAVHPRPEVLGPQRRGRVHGSSALLLRHADPEHHHRLDRPRHADEDGLGSADLDEPAAAAVRGVYCRWAVSTLCSLISALTDVPGLGSLILSAWWK